MQNNCLCRFNNLHKRHKNQIERERWLWNAKHITIIKQTKLKGIQMQRRGTALSRLHIMQSSQGYIRTVCRDASHYRATRVIYSLPSLPMHTLQQPSVSTSFRPHAQTSLSLIYKSVRRVWVLDIILWICMKLEGIKFPLTVTCHHSSPHSPSHCACP